MPPAIGQHYEFEGQRYVVVEATDDMGGLVRGMNGDGGDCWFDTKGAVLVENTVCTDENTLVATVQTDDVVATAQTDSTVQTEVQYTLPGLRTDNPAEILPLHRLLLALRDSSDRTGHEVLEMLPPEITNKFTTTNRAYNDSRLPGGGFAPLWAAMHVALFYCGNMELENGLPYCRRLQPEGTKVTDHCNNCGHALSAYPHHVFRLGPRYEFLLLHGDLAQRLADYHPTSIQRLSGNGPVLCTESATTATRDFRLNPAYFELNVVPCAGEEAYWEPPEKLALGSEMLPVWVMSASDDSFTIRLKDGSTVNLHGQECSSLIKIGGHFPINVSVYVDGAEVFKGSSIIYSNKYKTEDIRNIAEHHRQRHELCALMGFESGGIGHNNVKEMSVWYEQQRRRLQDTGHKVNGVVELFLPGSNIRRRCHNPTVRRNEINCSLDDPEMRYQAGLAGGRQLNSMQHALPGFDAYGTNSRALFFFLTNANFHVATEMETISKHAGAEEALGTAQWKSHVAEQAVKHDTVAAGGCAWHNLPPDVLQNIHARYEYERKHWLGILDNTFREFLCALMDKADRLSLCHSQQALRQYRGAQKIFEYVKLKLDGDTAYTKAQEKLIQKENFRLRRIQFDFQRRFRLQNEKHTAVRQVPTFVRR